MCVNLLNHPQIQREPPLFGGARKENMTTELEKQFFDTFGIEPKYRFKGCKLGAKYYCEICDEPTCKGCDDAISEIIYPQITDRILLELICIVSERRILPNCDVNGLKEYVLKELCTMIMSEKTKQQVKALFKEE